MAVTHSPGNKKVQSWLDEMKGKGLEFYAVECDVTDARFVRGGREESGSRARPVDILVNNAGITKDTTFRKMSKSDWDAVIRTNLDSVFNMTKPVLDGMVGRKWGRVINISSVNGQKGQFGQTQLLGGQGRYARLHQGARARGRAQRASR